jgi:predicted dehydrogenase
VAAVHDIDEQRLEDAKSKGLKTYENRSEFLADEEINFVLIATPNHIHKDYAIEALRAGKHVICEKPVTLSVKELDEIIEVSKETGNIFTVHHNRRWDTDYRVLREAVEDNMIGNVYTIESHVFGNNGQIYGWRTRPEYGGGMVLDWGVHLLDHFTFMYPDKKIVSVYAQLFSVINKEVEDLIKVDLRFEDGPAVHVEIGTFGLVKRPRFMAYGDLGTMKIDDFSGENGNIKVLKHRIDEMGKVIIDTPAGPTRTMAPQPEECFMEKELPKIKKPWPNLYGNLVNVINGKEELYVKPESARRTMLLIEAVFESARQNQAIKLNI